MSNDDGHHLDRAETRLRNAAAAWRDTRRVSTLDEAEHLELKLAAREYGRVWRDLIDPPEPSEAPAAPESSRGRPSTFPVQLNDSGHALIPEPILLALEAIPADDCDTPKTIFFRITPGTAGTSSITVLSVGQIDEEAARDAAEDD